MQIGEKIKTLRMSKLMTQSDLAGDRITRNMLSSIEHGTALPSLPTALYLAERLGVPVGYLLAEDGDELAYRKMNAISNIKKALASGDYAGALALLSATDKTGEDDELALICAQCEYGLAVGALISGRLRVAAAGLDRALLASRSTIYDTDWLRARIAVLFRYLATVSPTLLSDVLDVDEVDTARSFGDELCEYVLALEAMEQDQLSDVITYIERRADSLYAVRLRALLLMREERFVEAERALEQLLAKDELTFGLLLFEVFGDLETCYRRNNDYKRAYEFQGSRLELLERLLEEI